MTAYKNSGAETPGPVEAGVEFIELGGYYSKLFGLTPNEVKPSREYVEVRYVNGKKYFYAKKAGGFDVYVYVDYLKEGRIL